MQESKAQAEVLSYRKKLAAEARADLKAYKAKLGNLAGDVVSEAEKKAEKSSDASVQKAQQKAQDALKKAAQLKKKAVKVAKKKVVVKMPKKKKVHQMKPEAAEKHLNKEDKDITKVEKKRKHFENGGFHTKVHPVHKGDVQRAAKQHVLHASLPFHEAHEEANPLKRSTEAKTMKMTATAPTEQKAEKPDSWTVPPPRKVHEHFTTSNIKNTIMHAIHTHKDEAPADDDDDDTEAPPPTAS